MEIDFSSPNLNHQFHIDFRTKQQSLPMRLFFLRRMVILGGPPIYFAVAINRRQAFALAFLWKYGAFKIKADKKAQTNASILAAVPRKTRS